MRRLIVHGPSMAAMEMVLGCMRWGCSLLGLHPRRAKQGHSLALAFLRHANLRNRWGYEMGYRRADVAGGTYFFTVNLAERKRTLLVDYVDVPLRSVMREVKAKHPFHIDAMVILPDHLHAGWTLPVGDGDYPTRWMLIKVGFSRNIPKGERRNASRVTKGGRSMWQRRYREYLFWNDGDYERHVDYVHFKPVKHGFVSPGLGMALFDVSRLYESRRVY